MYRKLAKSFVILGAVISTLGALIIPLAIVRDTYDWGQGIVIGISALFGGLVWAALGAGLDTLLNIELNMRK